MYEENYGELVTITVYQGTLVVYVKEVYSTFF